MYLSMYLCIYVCMHVCIHVSSALNYAPNYDAFMTMLLVYIYTYTLNQKRAKGQVPGFRAPVLSCSWPYLNDQIMMLS